MPVMTGIEMLTQLKKDPQLKNIPVIMLTAESGKENVMQIIQMGVSNYIVKPFRGEQLIERAKPIVKLLPKGEAPATGLIRKQGKIFVLQLPEKITRPTIAEMEDVVVKHSGEISTSGTPNLLLNLQQVSEINVSLVKLILTILNKCGGNGIKMAVFCNPGLEKDLKRLKELKGLEIHHNVENVKAAFS